MVAAITTLLCYFIAFIITHRAVALDWPIDYNLATVMKSIVASLCMGIVLISTSLWVVTDILRISYVIGEIFLGIIIYCSVIMLLGTFSSKEMVYLKKLVFKGDN